MRNSAPAFDELNFSEALKSLWTLVAETDGYLTANAPWKKPADRSEQTHRLLQARVLATAAEAIRVITALVYPILPDSASKVWQQLGQGEIADAAKQAFFTNLAWGGLKPGTKFGEPAPLFPRAEKDAVPYAESRRRKQPQCNRCRQPGGESTLNGSGSATFVASHCACAATGLSIGEFGAEPKQ